MQDVRHALNEVEDLYARFLGQSAPVLEPGSYLSFPPGVDPLSHVVQEVQHLKQLAGQVAVAPPRGTWVPPADCFASEDTFVIRLEVPGVDRKALTVLVTGVECLVRGERKRPETLITMRPVFVEQPWGQFERRIPLPGGALAEKVTARYEEGLLEISVPIGAAKPPVEHKVEVV